MNKNQRILLTAIATIVITGCSEDERLARLAQESVQQQRSQNEEMTRLNREVAEGVKRLVESENESRKELTSLQREVQCQQADVGVQRDRLESERKEIARQRYRDSLLVPVLHHAGLLLVCILPLLLAWYLLHDWRSEPQDDLAISELLIEEFASDRPRLLPPGATAPSIEHRDQERLPEPDDPAAFHDETVTL
ncbi:MAG: hypothetical protein H8E66_25290 [Planctomycetes bacterium]|nr:hypothetical protein [Planctomycetota bacterium]